MRLTSGMHAKWKRIRGGNALGLALLAGPKHGDTFTWRFIIQFFENIEKFHFAMAESGVKFERFAGREFLLRKDFSVNVN